MPGPLWTGLSIMIQIVKGLRVIAIVSFILLAACSGVNKAIISAKAYSITSQSGTVQLDEKGNEITPIVQNIITVYVESKYKDVEFDSAWINNTSYAVQVQKILNPLELGFEENSGQKVTITPSAQNYIYQLQATPVIKKGEEFPASLTIRLLRKGKNTVRSVGPVTRLQAYDSQ